MYCSRACRSKFETTRPPREVLLVLIEHYPATQIGQMFRVTSRAVKKWLLKEGIQPKPPGYWQKKHCQAGRCLPPPAPRKPEIDAAEKKMRAERLAKLKKSGQVAKSVDDLPEKVREAKKRKPRPVKPPVPRPKETYPEPTQRERRPTSMKDIDKKFDHVKYLID